MSLHHCICAYRLIALGVVSGCYALVGGVEAAARLLEITYTLPAFVPALHPGLAFVYGARGDMRVMLAAGSVLIACLSFLVIFSRDRYPELYEISRAGWEVRSRFREGAHARSRRRKREGDRRKSACAYSGRCGSLVMDELAGVSPSKYATLACDTVPCSRSA